MPAGRPRTKHNYERRIFRLVALLSLPEREYVMRAIVARGWTYREFVLFATQALEQGKYDAPTT